MFLFRSGVLIKVPVLQSSGICSRRAFCSHQLQVKLHKRRYAQGLGGLLCFWKWVIWGGDGLLPECFSMPIFSTSFMPPEGFLGSARAVSSNPIFPAYLPGAAAAVRGRGLEISSSCCVSCSGVGWYFNGLKLTLGSVTHQRARLLWEEKFLPFSKLVSSQVIKWAHEMWLQSLLSYRGVLAKQAVSTEGERQITMAFWHPKGPEIFAVFTLKIFSLPFQKCTVYTGTNIEILQCTGLHFLCFGHSW